MSNSTRPSSSYDERFVVPLEASRRGAHRARVSPVMAALPVAVVVGIVVGAIALVYLFLGGGTSDVGAGATTVASPSVTPTTGPTGSSPSDAEQSPSSSLSPGAIDESITLDVYNGTTPGVSGLAGRASTKLAAAGWTIGEVATWTGSRVARTTVYYSSADQKATAQAVVKAVGRGVVKLSPSTSGGGMALVIGNDYPGAKTQTSAPTSRSTTASRTTTGGASSTTVPPEASSSVSPTTSQTSPGATSPSATDQTGGSGTSPSNS